MKHVGIEIKFYNLETFKEQIDVNFIDLDSHLVVLNYKVASLIFCHFWRSIELRELTAVVGNSCVYSESEQQYNELNNYIFSFAEGRVKLFLPLTGYKLYQAVFCPLQRVYSNEQMLTYRSIVTLRVLKADIVLVRAMCKGF